MVQKRKFRFNSKVWLSALAVLILIAALIVFLVVRQPKKVATIPSNNPVNSANSQSSASQSSSSNSATSASQSSAPSTKSSNPPAPSGAGPVTPYGDFVNSHSVSSSSAMYSVCNTSPGATCYVQFTNGDLVRKLDTQTTDSNGATYWNWDTSSLSPGSWTVMAVATLNGQTKTATDARLLVVQQ